MKLPYEKARAGDNALADIQKTLGQFGCQAFGTMFNNDSGSLIVQFRWRGREVSLEASWKGYAAAWQRSHPFNHHRRVSRAEYDRRALAIGRVAVCSMLRDWIKGQVTAIECGIMSFDAAFMPHMLLPNGARMLDRAKELLPPSEERKVVEFKS